MQEIEGLIKKGGITVERDERPLETPSGPQMFEDLLARPMTIRERAAAFLGCQPKDVLEILRSHVFRPGKVFDKTQNRMVESEPFTDSELQAALVLIGRYGLDPARKEIHCTRDKTGRVMLVVGVDGWLKTLLNHPDYDGHEIEYDPPVKDGPRGEPVSCTCRIFSKSRERPTTLTLYFAEWEKGRRAPNAPPTPWDLQPYHMLGTRTLCHCARQFTPIGGAAILPEEYAALIEAQEIDERTSVLRGEQMAIAEEEIDQELSLVDPSGLASGPPDDAELRSVLWAEISGLKGQLSESQLEEVRKAAGGVLTRKSSLEQLEAAIDRAREVLR